MGSSQSSHANAKIQEHVPSSEKLQSSESVGGRKSPSGDIHVTPKTRSVENDSLFVYTSDSEESDCLEDENDEEIESGLTERRMILEDAKMLKAYAVFHLRPERPVNTRDATAFGSNYFSRASTDGLYAEKECKEREQILEECELLKKYAGFHLHPEKPVEMEDSAMFSRSYYSRPSAPEQETVEEADERAIILEEAAMLKKYAEFHLHPEKPVVTSDAAASGRNYFSRASADDSYVEEESEEREQILRECAELKKYADFHLHPEKPVKTEDATAFSRSYYSRPSAPEQETVEEADERAIILEEAAMLKKYAEFHLHPEKPVVTSDASASGRNYFSRASADDFYGGEESEEREQILRECAELKKYAGFHLHPEKPVKTEDATVFSRSYYSRPSAPEQETMEEADERAIILEEAAMLKKYAEFHLHPEKPVVTSDAAASGRNYFSRASADDFYGEESKEREQILRECAELKKYADFHLHPEKPVNTEDATVFSRSYYSRPSAPEQDTVEEADERAMILEEVAMLKRYADFHLHPEKPVDMAVGSMHGRNYFNRFTAPIDAEAESKPANTDVVSNKQPSKPDEIKSLQAVKHSSIDGNKEEETMNRSPSSIMLFGYEDNEAF